MAGARYQGAWLRSQQEWYVDPERFTVDTATDPRHGDKTDAPPPLMMDAPVMPGGGEIATDAYMQEYTGLPVATEIDRTPVQGQGNPEETGHGYGGLTTPGADIKDIAAMRGQDVGAAKRSTSSSPVYQFFNEVFFGYFTKGFEPPPITQGMGDAVLRRGLNGYPDNDGEGGRPTSWNVDNDIAIVGGTWRRGDYEGSNVDRDFTPPDRRHGEVKMVENDHSTIIGDAPPPAKSDVYASPFSSLQKFMPKRRRVSGVRQDPGAWDEDLMATPTFPVSAPSVDGMVAR